MKYLFISEMKKLETKKISSLITILSISLLFSIFNIIKCDLLVRSPPELKSQFISKQLYNK